MEKHKIIIGIMFILIMVGFSGCTDFGIVLTNIGDINANPDNYYNKKVTIEGSCYYSAIYGKITDDNEHSLWFKYDTKINGKYRLTGILVEENNVLFDFYLNVTSVKAL